jgi:hypothetical protein
VAFLYTRTAGATEELNFTFYLIKKNFSWILVAHAYNPATWKIGKITVRG